MNRVNALTNLGHLDEAIAVHEEAIIIRRRLVEQEGRLELADSLANAFYNLALAN